MNIQEQLITRRIYDIDLRHQICKEHIEDGIKLADLVRKYDLSCHSLIHDWLRKLGYLPGHNRRTYAQYVRHENYSMMSKKSLTLIGKSSIDFAVSIALFQPGKSRLFTCETEAKS